MTSKRVSLRRWFGLWLCFAISSLAKDFDWPSMDDKTLLTHACNYATSDTKKHQAGQALTELKRRGPRGMKALMDHMHIKNIYIRVTADNWVRGSKDEAFVPVLFAYLDSEHERTRSQAAFLLGYYVLPDFAGSIYPLLDHEKTDKNAIRTLGKWKVAAAIPRLRPYLAHEEERYRIFAANALRDIADPATIDDLLPLLNDPFFTVRYVAARALKAIGKIEPLKAARSNMDEQAQRHLDLVIGELESEN